MTDPGIGIGESTEVASNVGPGFELLALGLGGIAHRVEARSGAGATERTGGPDEPEALHAARASFDAVLRHVGRDGAAFDLKLNAYRSVRRGHGGVAPPAAAGALAALQLIPSDVDVPLALLVRVVAEAEQRAFGLPRAASAMASLCGGLGVTTELHPPRALRWRGPGWYVAVLSPDVQLRPHALKAALPNHVPLMKAQRHAARSHALVAALHDADEAAAREAFGDAIVEPVLGQLFTGANPALHGARQAGAVGAWMTGTGPNLCALATTADGAQRAGDAMRAALEAHRVDAGLRVVPIAPVRLPETYR